MIDRQQVWDIVEAGLEGTDCFMVDVIVTPANEITVEIDSSTGVDIDLCVALTRRVEEAFDRDAEDYSLEIGSAGLTSPFKVDGQYEKNLGNEVEVLTADGRKLRGELTEYTPGAEAAFTIEVERKVKEPGQKRPHMVKEPVRLSVSDTKYVKYSFNFK